ncbi:MAG: Hsp70 family protein [Alphaproteobacteria bacterium]|nr:Hsp70 family protein [Alphaproteobacteria bacterium]
MGRAIGIDLGTTNSCAAVVDESGPRVITYPNGAKTIPSVFAIDKSGDRLVGEEARAQAALNPSNTVAAAKRLIGRSFGSKAVERMQQVFTYELLEGAESEVLVRVSDQVMTLEQISAAILMRIKDNAERALGEEVDQAVITVPAYFNDRQRQAVRAAGRLAGLHVLRVLNEPTAAALAYGLGRTLDQRVAIYDLGGGTFDISIIDIKDKVFEVVATGGDTFLGGVDFDDRVMQWVLKQFLEQHDIDLSYDRGAITRIRDAAELAKIALSADEVTRIHIEQIADDDGEILDLDVELTRARLEELTGDLVRRSIDTCERILLEAGTDRTHIDELLLVGGQSRMPMVRRELEGFLGRTPSEKVHPDEAVALGAAIMAKSLSARGVPEKDVTLLDVLPMAIGLAKPNGMMYVLFPKNEHLPAKKTRVLTTSKEDQKTLVLRMYQGESDDCDENDLLGSFVFYGLRRGPKGEVRLEVTFHIDSEGILNLSARDKDTGESVASRIRLDHDGDKPKKKSRKAKKKSDDDKTADVPTLDMPMGASVAAADRTADGAPPPLTLPPPAAASALPPLAEPEPEPARPSIDNLRSQMRRPAAPVPEEKKEEGGVVGWFKRVFGGTKR